MSRLTEVVQDTPAATLGLVALCTSCYLLQMFTGFSLAHFTFCPQLVLYSNQYYRVVTSPFLHANLMHIGMNMLSTLAIGTRLERRMGTVQLLWIVTVSVFITALLHTSIAVLLASRMFQWSGELSGHSLGFSGILFHLSVLECRFDEQQEQRSRRVFGILSVPTYTYPWVL